MRRLAIAAIAAASTLTFTQISSAADMVVKAASRVALPASYNWTGCYLGANVGGGWGRSTGSRSAYSTDFSGPVGGGAVPASLDTDSSGVIGGGQLGCNYQTSYVVFGLEADLQASGISGSSTVLLPPSAAFDASTSTGSEKITSFGTLRGRIGITATPNLLLYGTGGLAYGRVSNGATLVYNPPVDGIYGGATSENKSGWAAGAGAEYAFGNNWSAKVEYLYLDLGTTTVREMDPRSGTSFVDYQFQHRDHIIRIGLNYKFGNGSILAGH